MKKFLFYLLFIIFLNATNVYFMPIDGYKAEKNICDIFTHAKKNIKIAMYTFTNKKIAKALKIAAKNGTYVYIISDREESKYKRSVIPNLAAIKKFNIYLLSGKKYKDGDKAKMHVKMAIIDDKYLIIGSANYSYSAFFKNYEYILISQDNDLIQKFNNFFSMLKQNAKPYRLSQ